MIKDYKTKQLKELWEEYNSNCESADDWMSFRDYVKRESENDPGFFRWLYDNDELGDYENPDEEAFAKYLESLKYGFTSNVYLTKMAKDLIKIAIDGTTIPEHELTVTDWDLDRIYMEAEGYEYIIRTWDIREVGETVRVRWSLVLLVPNKGGRELKSSITTTFNKKDYPKE